MGVNNKLRDTLDFADKELRRATEDPRYGEDLVYLVGCMRTVANACRAALAEPVRNCEVGTAEEQEERFRNYCWNHSSRDKNMECQCPIDAEGKAGCKLTWSQMPYTEGGAK